VNKLADIIPLLAEAPDGQLDAQGAKMCAEWDGEDPVRFLRDLLDLCVRYAWASGFVITLLETTLADEPLETEEEAETRRQDLLDKWEAA
jgi:hypothetical protein